MRRSLGLAAVGVALAVASGCSEFEAPGNPAIYDAIDRTTDCDRLKVYVDTGRRQQPGRDDSYTEHQLALVGYSVKAIQRMEDLGCPDP